MVKPPCPWRRATHLLAPGLAYLGGVFCLIHGPVDAVRWDRRPAGPTEDWTPSTGPGVRRSRLLSARRRALPARKVTPGPNLVAARATPERRSYRWVMVAPPVQRPLTSQTPPSPGPFFSLPP